MSFRSSRKRSSYWVRAKLYPVERSSWSFNFKRPPCDICAYVKETTFYQHSVQEKSTKLITDLTAWGNA